ncbi:hypothetical protein THAOC_30758, partial [Thalassiosira oceanica]
MPPPLLGRSGVRGIVLSLNPPMPPAGWWDGAARPCGPGESSPRRFFRTVPRPLAAEGRNLPVLRDTTCRARAFQRAAQLRDWRRPTNEAAPRDPRPNKATGGRRRGRSSSTLERPPFPRTNEVDPGGSPPTDSVRLGRAVARGPFRVRAGRGGPGRSNRLPSGAPPTAAGPPVLVLRT